MIAKYIGRTYTGIIKKKSLYSVVISKDKLRFCVNAVTLRSAIDHTGCDFYYPISKIESIYRDWEDSYSVYKLIKKACKFDIIARIRNYKVYRKMKKKERDEI